MWEREDEYVPSIEPYVDPVDVYPHGWIARPKATSTIVFSGEFSESGDWGNQAADGHVYKTAAIEVRLRT
ncbi:MAG: hypothetical protein QM831_18575 [Kofleriaceae bacterium]